MDFRKSLSFFGYMGLFLMFSNPLEAGSYWTRDNIRGIVAGLDYPLRVRVQHRSALMLVNGYCVGWDGIPIFDEKLQSKCCAAMPSTETGVTFVDDNIKTLYLNPKGDSYESTDLDCPLDLDDTLVQLGDYLLTTSAKDPTLTSVASRIKAASCKVRALKKGSSLEDCAIGQYTTSVCSDVVSPDDAKCIAQTCPTKNPANPDEQKTCIENKICKKGQAGANVASCVMEVQKTLKNAAIGASCDANKSDSLAYLACVAASCDGLSSADCKQKLDDSGIKTTCDAATLSPSDFQSCVKNQCNGLSSQDCGSKIGANTNANTNANASDLGTTTNSCLSFKADPSRYTQCLASQCVNISAQECATKLKRFGLTIPANCVSTTMSASDFQSCIAGACTNLTSDQCYAKFSPSSDGSVGASTNPNGNSNVQGASSGTGTGTSSPGGGSLSGASTTGNGDVTNSQGAVANDPFWKGIENDILKICETTSTCDQTDTTSAALASGGISKTVKDLAQLPGGALDSMSRDPSSVSSTQGKKGNLGGAPSGSSFSGGSSISDDATVNSSGMNKGVDSSTAGSSAYSGGGSGASMTSGGGRVSGVAVSSSASKLGSNFSAQTDASATGTQLSADALAIKDPPDYFTRTRVNDSLFKIISRRITIWGPKLFDSGV